jgi:putative ABC transport system permease protein
MRLLIKLAWRSIWRNKRRTILTICAIVFATFFLIVRNGVAGGTYDSYILNIMNSYVGSLQIQRPDYQKNPSIYKSHRFDDRLKNTIAQNPEIKSSTGRIETSGLISYKSNSFVAMIIAISPETEKTTTTFCDRVREGKLFASDTSSEVVIGKTLSKNLGAKIGDKIILLSQGFDGSLSNKLFTISGIIKTGAETDNMAVVMGMKTCQEFLGMEGRVNSIVLSIPEVSKIAKVKDNISSALNQNNFSILTWEEILPDIKQTIEFDNIKDNVIFGILVIIVAFSILNTILMSITERFREFGITLSIGMQQIKLLIQIIFEAFFITILGIFLGNVAGGLLNFYIYLNPISLTGDMGQIYEDYGFKPLIEASMNPYIFINTSILIFIIFVIACIYPLIKVYKLEPLKGIRYT